MLDTLLGSDIENGIEVKNNDSFISMYDMLTHDNVDLKSSSIIRALERLTSITIVGVCSKATIDSKFKVNLIYNNGLIIDYVIIRVKNNWKADHIHANEML